MNFIQAGHYSTSVEIDSLEGDLLATFTTTALRGDGQSMLAMKRNEELCL